MCQLDLLKLPERIGPMEYTPEYVELKLKLEQIIEQLHSCIEALEDRVANLESTL